MTVSVLDKNKIFFALIHYILSEQKNVNWILKTSLIDFTGISSLLEEKPYKKDSILDDVVDYVTSIKPYHVQFSHYFEHYQTASETVAIPGNDWIEPTINLRFDAIKTSPDINKTFYEVVTSLPTITSTNEKEYNITDLCVYCISDGKFYVRQRTDSSWSWAQSDEVLKSGYYYTTKKGLFYKNQMIYKINVVSSIATSITTIKSLLSFLGDTFTVYQGSSTNQYIISVKTNSYDNTSTFTKIKNKLGSDYTCTEIGLSYTLWQFDDDDTDEFIDSHAANRLFYLGIHDEEEIKKELNGNFKGIEINGSVFDIANFGYDIFNYDTTDYDSPTIIYDYLFVNEKESRFEASSEEFVLETGFEYKKAFVNVNEQRFTIPNTLKPSAGEENIVYIVNSNGTMHEYNNFEIGYSNEENYIDTYRNIMVGEKYYIVVNDTKSTYEIPHIKRAYVLEATTFSESSSEILRRERVPYTANSTVRLSIPASDINDNSKIAVQIRTLTGKHKPLPISTYNFENGKILIDTTTLHVGEHIIITSFDYKYLFDKIYTWEDRYGRSNNIVNLTGDKFLRARYNDERPSELIVSYPLNSLFMYNYDTKGDCSVFFNTYKNEMLFSSYLKNVETKIVAVGMNEDTSLNWIQLDSLSHIEQPTGKILVNSEIIEYGSVDTTENKLLNLKRSINGTVNYMNLIPKYEPHKRTHAIDDIVYPYNDDEWYSQDRNNTYKSYSIVSPLIKTYNCPSGVKQGSSVEITKISKINLLNDVYSSTEDIQIDSCNVVTGLYDSTHTYQEKLKEETTTTKYYGDWSLKINDDEIPFTTIYKDQSKDDTYHILGFTLDGKYKNSKEVIYKASESYVYGCLPETVDNFSIQYVEGDMTHQITIDNNNNVYVVLPSGDKLFRILDCTIQTDASGNKTIKKLGKVINYYSSTYDTVSEQFNYEEHPFGTISNNNVYRRDGSLYAKIEDMNFIVILVQAVINSELFVGESLHINVIN